MNHILGFLIVWLIALAPLASAQSLADVARREEARRKAVTVPGKVYTNADLKTDASNATPRAPIERPAVSVPEPDSKVPALNLPGGKAEPVEEAKGESYWRALISGARQRLERSKVLADALQSRLNALATDIVNRDDPGQRSQLELERQRALAELDRMTAEIVEQTKAIAEIEEDARKAGVPPGWLR